MDDTAHAIEVHVGAGFDVDECGELIHRVAQESCHADADRGDDASFVMVTTEMRHNVVVKTVVFERDDAAQRFRTALSAADPRLTPRD